MRLQIGFSIYFLSLCCFDISYAYTTKAMRIYKTRIFMSEEPLTTAEFSELPESFEDAVRRVALRTSDVINTGKTRIRIDFDTSIGKFIFIRFPMVTIIIYNLKRIVGDQTYTSLKNTIPLIKLLSSLYSDSFDLYPREMISSDFGLNATEKSDVIASLPTDWSAEESKKKKTMTIFFPDMGAAALARRDWKMGTVSAEVPPCVQTANIQNDPLSETDKLAILLCPLSYEADYVYRVVNLCDEKGIPCVMINPNLINMDQGVIRRIQYCFNLFCLREKKKYSIDICRTFLPLIGYGKYLYNYIL